MKRIALPAAWLMIFATDALAATQEKIASWVLSCPEAGVADHAPAAEPCLLRLERRLLDQAGVTIGLEVLAEGKSLVPVLAVRGLPGGFLAAAAMAGQTEASIQLDGGKQQVLQCAPSGAGYICSLAEDAVRVLAAGLPAARSATVGVSFAVGSIKPLPMQQKILDLAGTAATLARLQAAGASQVPVAATAPASHSLARLLEMLAGGYPNGIADLQRLLGKYRDK